LGWNYAVRQHDTQVELYIDVGSEDVNKAFFRKLFDARDAVETAFGEELEWQELLGRRACRIRKVITIGGYRDPATWPELQEAMVDAMVRLESALRPQLSSTP
jgi:hypothetical protein